MPIATTIGLQGIAIANDVDVLKVVALAVHQQSLGLSLAIGPDGQVAEGQVAAVVSGKGSTTRWERATNLVSLDVGRMRRLLRKYTSSS